MAPDGAWRTIVCVAFAVSTLAAIAAWIRHEAVALDQEQWCPCASAATTVRIVPSRAWPSPAADERPVVTPSERDADRALDVVGVE
jgi:hypothetical protein